MTHAQDLTLSANGAENSNASANAGSQSGGSAGAVAINVAPQDIVAEIDPGTALKSPATCRWRPRRSSSARQCERWCRERGGGFGAAIAVNAPVASTTALLDRGATVGNDILVRASSNLGAQAMATAGEHGGASGGTADWEVANWLGAQAAMVRPRPCAAEYRQRARRRRAAARPRPAVDRIGGRAGSGRRRSAPPAPASPGAWRSPPVATSRCWPAGPAMRMPRPMPARSTIWARSASASRWITMPRRSRHRSAPPRWSARWASPSRRTCRATGRRPARPRRWLAPARSRGVAGAVALNLVDNSTDAEILGTAPIDAPDFIDVEAAGNTDAAATAGRFNRRHGCWGRRFARRQSRGGSHRGERRRRGAIGQPRHDPDRG